MPKPKEVSKFRCAVLLEKADSQALAHCMDMGLIATTLVKISAHAATAMLRNDTRN